MDIIFLVNCINKCCKFFITLYSLKYAMPQIISSANGNVYLEQSIWCVAEVVKPSTTASPYVELKYEWPNHKVKGK